VDSRIQVQLREDGGGSIRQSWMETSGLWPTGMFERERQGTSQSKSSHKSLLRVLPSEVGEMV